MKAVSSSDLERVMKEFFRHRRLAFNYTMHASYCGSLDAMELVAYDKEHDLCHAVTISYEAAYASTSFGDVYGKAINELYDAVLEHEAYFLRGYH